MRKTNINQAKKHLARLQEIVAKKPTPVFYMSKEEAIEALHKTREVIWGEKFASRH